MLLFVLFLIAGNNNFFESSQHGIYYHSMLEENTDLDFSYRVHDDCIDILHNGKLIWVMLNQTERMPLLSRDTIETIWLPDSTGGVVLPDKFVYNPINNNMYIHSSSYGFRCIAVCDGQTGERLPVILTGWGAAYLAHSITSNKLYCANDIDSTIDVINCDNNSIIQTIQLQGTPSGLVWNAINNEIYCPSSGNNRVEVIDCVDDTIIVSIPLGAYPWPPVLFNHISNKIYCVCRVGMGNDSTVVIDGYTHNVITRIATAGWPLYHMVLNTINNKVYCASQHDDVVTVIDGLGDSLITTIPVGSYPRCIAYNSEMNRIYVGHVMSSDVYVIDGATNQVITSIYLGECAWSITYDSLDNRVFVASYSGGINGSTIVIDCSTNAIIDYLPAGTWPRGIFWEEEFNQVWIANSGAGDFPTYTIDGYLADSLAHSFTTLIGYAPYASILNTLTNKYYSISHSGKYLSILDMSNPSNSIMKEVGSGPWDVIDNPLENKIYCANRWSDTVTIIEGMTDSIIAEVPTDSEPVALAFNQIDNKIYVANLCSANLTVIDGNTNNVLGEIPVGNRPIPVLWNPIDNKIYVGNSQDGSVTIIDAHADTVITTVLAGDYQWSLTHNPNDDKIYCANFFSDDVTVIDGVNNQIITKIPMGSPYTFAYNSVNNKIYCANLLDNSISVIDGVTDSIIAEIPIHVPYSLLYNPTTNTIFCAHTNEYPPQDAVAVIDCMSDSILTDSVLDSQVWFYGLGSPKKALAFDSLNNVVYLDHYFSSKISVIDGATGIDEITSVTPEATFLRITPSPAVDNIKIEYSLPIANSAQVRIYDVGGRLVRQFDNLPVQHSGQIIWGGRDNAGKKLPSGVYLLKFQAGDYSVTEKLLLIR